MANISEEKIRELIEKDTAKPMKKKYITRELIVPACPKCGETLFSAVHGSHCEWCGQALDKTLWEL